MRPTTCLVFTIVLLISQHVLGQSYITDSPKEDQGLFPIAANGSIPAGIYVDTADDWLVQKAASLLQEDIERVTGMRPAILHALPSTATALIIMGSLERSPLVGGLVRQRKLEASGLKGQWEAFSYQVLPHPFKGIDRALVIAGSDKRGTAYGALTLSRQMGVSPWYWWADVPVETKRAVYFDLHAWQKGHPSSIDKPSVQYRGFFINDEAPAFSGWARAKFGGLNHQCYEHVFELLLRLRANYLWPAMWGNAFNDDDKQNPELADRYGIVMGTSHHEPMLRAQQEWKRYGSGPWNYQTNSDTLKAFWKKGIQHMGNHESLVTIGMRGDGDMPMSEGANISLLEQIVKDQRQIISEVTGKPAAVTPQVWALYKEVQEYYDKGMRVPDDVTLLLCDDNWGNVRKLPMRGEPRRKGGYGMYYHFDYVGDPRNYKWVNTNQVSRVWEQMHLCWSYGIDRLWVVNVGDIKPMELPIEFFLDYAWSPDLMPAGSLPAYTRNWAARQFGRRFADTISYILDQYTRFNSRRKPELLAPDTYSLDNYDEARSVVDEYEALARSAKRIADSLPQAYQDAYFQLVGYPVQACANLNKLYLLVAQNRAAAAKNLPIANEYADEARTAYALDSSLSHYYNKEMAGGKWDHMMDQTHIGYTYWQQPEVNSMPALMRVNAADTGSTRTVSTDLNIHAHKSRKTPGGFQGFLEMDGYVSMEAEHYHKAYPAGTADADGSAASASAANPTKPSAISKGLFWQRIPGLGRTLSGMQVQPVTAASVIPGGNSPRLEYLMNLDDSGEIKIDVYCSPLLDFNRKPIRYAVSMDDEKPRLVTLTIGNDPDNAAWKKMVADNILIRTTVHKVSRPGLHTLRFWYVDPGVVLQKIVVDAGGTRPSYLGPPESIHGKD